MFRFDEREQQMIEKEKQLLEDVKGKDKPTFKDILAIIIAQYIIILPILIIGVIVFYLILLFITKIWLR